MDRLVCGDVGFDQTEIALRAAFISALNDIRSPSRFHPLLAGSTSRQ